MSSYALVIECSELENYQIHREIIMLIIYFYRPFPICSCVNHQRVIGDVVKSWDIRSQSYEKSLVTHCSTTNHETRGFHVMQWDLMLGYIIFGSTWKISEKPWTIQLANQQFHSRIKWLGDTSPGQLILTLRSIHAIPKKDRTVFPGCYRYGMFFEYFPGLSGVGNCPILGILDITLW